MKFQCFLQAFGLVAVLLGSLVSAAPANEDGLANVEARGVAGAEFSVLHHRGDIPFPAYWQVINNASCLFATQLVGSANSLNELSLLCKHFNTSRLATQGYNITIIRQVICDASKLPALQDNNVIRDHTIWYDTGIFVAQLNTTVLGNHFLICDFISVPAANSVGLNGSQLELGFQCTLPNDGPSPITTSTSTTPSATAVTTVKRRAIPTRAAGSPGPGYGYTFNSEATYEYIEPAPTEMYPGEPIVTPNPDSFGGY